MDYTLPGSSVHGILQARVLECVAISFSRGIVQTQGLNPGLLYCRKTLYHLSHQGRLRLIHVSHVWASEESSYCSINLHCLSYCSHY